METKDDISYGVIPFYKNGNEWQVFLIYQYGSAGDIFWTFPKGHPEAGEEPETAARRELTEETGITISELLTDKTVSQSYTFTHDDVLINKQVTYFLATVTDPAYSLQEDEVQDAGWFSLAEAREKLTYDSAKALLDLAVDRMETTTA